jgi:Zn-dependent peptidase ImmA (M78 family)
MAIRRTRHFPDSGDHANTDIALIDSCEKLLHFARSKGICIIPLDVERVAKELNISVEYTPLENDLSGTLRKDEATNSWNIQVNEKNHPNRQRYTIGHELGHFCLHRHLENRFVDRIFFRCYESSKTEWQANEFAGAILMPEQELREAVRSGMRGIYDLADRFKVSTIALRIRAKTLGMSGHGL